MNRTYSVLVIGAGAAGIGFGVALKQLINTSFLIIDKGEIGENFKNWPKETKLITPSFTMNGFGMPDLNAIAPFTSPAFTLGKEHLSGKEYAEYLALVADTFELPVQENTAVEEITQQESLYRVKTSQGTIQAKYIIMAVGEFSAPNRSQIKGSEWGIHYGEIASFADFLEPQQIVIGGNESGIDAAIHLAENGKEVLVYTSSSGLHSPEADPSIRLSPSTRERLLNEIQRGAKIKLTENAKLMEISPQGAGYRLTFENGTILHSQTRPILCTGFVSEARNIAPAFFDFSTKEVPLLTNSDESDRGTNLFMIGPSVRQQKVIFCYIYKFRQRFAPIITEIAKREGQTIKQEKLKDYVESNMYLEDLSCCDVSCEC